MQTCLCSSVVGQSRRVSISLPTLCHLCKFIHSDILYAILKIRYRLEKRPSIQLITVGPVIDLYGRFAAEKLNRLMELYPDRVYSKPEFTALPPYLFSGADFALIPSRDEPFGLVAVEFGRKGALGVGSRLGGLGLMPGWVSGLFLYDCFTC